MGQTTGICIDAEPTGNTTLLHQPHQSGPSIVLIAVTVVAVILFVLLIAACIRLYKKRAHDKDRAIRSSAGTFLSNDVPPTKLVRLWRMQRLKYTSSHQQRLPPIIQGTPKERRKRGGSHSQRVPTLPAYGYTSHDLQFTPESDAGEAGSLFPDEERDEMYTASLGSLNVLDTNGVLGLG